jgi:hypothetical protein
MIAVSPKEGVRVLCHFDPYLLENPLFLRFSPAVNPFSGFLRHEFLNENFIYSMPVCGGIF